MTKRMLIDATHPEETRVVVVDGNKLDDFDFETASKKQLKGNIYLARVTRVEPSLQAAFVEYGGNRHGFLAFSEIHPDYYRIPIEDREALLREEQAEAMAEDDDVDDESGADDDTSGEDTSGEDQDGSEDADQGPAGDASDARDSDTEYDEPEESGDEVPARAAEVRVQTKKGARPETVGGDAMEEVRRRRKPSNRRYKIQEVVARRQIMLVQVVKEERGNKGAALTTYLSLAGRYCVLMPNTARGGGVSRKITHVGDRKRLKQIVEGLDVPEGMAVIVRTAGSQRTKAEIKRDYEYLLRLWDEIRQTTLDSTAPCLIYEEANLIKRSIRDLYTRDLDEVLVDGDDGYRIAKDFMKTLIPSHAKRVKRYKDTHVPLLHRFQVESQLDAIHSPVVELKSGGYIVMNQTEALVAIDVNSGRSTSERNIEETALKTNLEAADEVARQLRLRDLAGLVVIDFIDMEESRNQHAVERRMKEAMKSDRARIQIGRISHFGLMELSRQRLRPSLVEASTQVCPHCKGSGYIRSIDSTALHILRVIEEEGLRNRAAEIAVHVPAQVALYILNQKRDRLAEIELRYGTRVILEQDDSLVPPDHRLERLRPKTADERAAFQSAVAAGSANAAEIEEDEADLVEDDEDEADNETREEQEERKGRGRSRRRRRGGRRRPEDRGDERGEERSDDRSEDGGERPDDSDAEGDGEETAADGDERGDGDDDDESGDGRKRRRRGRRGGRRRSRRRRDGEEGSEESGSGTSDDDDDGDEDARASDAVGEPAVAASAAVAEVTSEQADLGENSSDQVPAAPTETVDVAEENVSAPEVATPETETAETAAETGAGTAAEDVPEKPAKAAKPAKKPAAKRPRRRKKTDDEDAAAEAPAAETPAAEAPVAETVAESPDTGPAAEEPLSGEVGEDRTAVEAPTETAEPAAQNLSSVPIEVRTLDKPVEKPRKGWWRR
ncbi:MAG: Rne/Rng family ribonuclease [Alphaproteobacteria bacterium]|nr:Rne/Rng family ribonuclease [Alphaproteobacteria bacterium]